MGLFKNLISSVLGDSVSEDIIDSSLDKAKEKALNKATEIAAEKATEAVVDVAVGASVSALKSIKKDSNPLQSPPPPNVPRPAESMSVMVAVNGQSYGPYERATLLEMISNGSLTKETYVFIQGMDSWQPAGQVDKVAALFGNTAPLPPVPPVPWAGGHAGNEAPAPQGDSCGNTFSPRLNQLITAAVADGEISDMERQVLIRNAQAEGVSMDEFVMVLEARLYEQRQTILAKNAENERQNKIAEAKIQAAANPVVAPAVSDKYGEIKKCPACGATVSAMEVKCSQCGHEFSGVQANSSISRLSEMLMKADEEASDSKVSVLTSMFSPAGSKACQKKVTIIQNFPIPNTKEDLIEFFTTACSNATVKDDGSIDTLKIREAWKAKAKQVLAKAELLLKDDAETLNYFKEMAKKSKIEKKSRFGF